MYNYYHCLGFVLEPEIPENVIEILLHPATPRGGDQAVMPTPRGRCRAVIPSGWGGLVYGIRWCWWMSRAWSPPLKGPGGSECVLAEDGSPKGGQGVGWGGSDG
jgi:hypothetical protein